MGSPLGPTLSNAFLVYHRKKKWLECCPLEYRPLYYRRYVDDIFVLFNLPEHLKRFHSYLNYCHRNIYFTIENEIDNRVNKADLPLLSTGNQPLVVFTPILTVSYHLCTKLACYIH